MLVVKWNQTSGTFSEGTRRVKLFATDNLAVEKDGIRVPRGELNFAKSMELIGLFAHFLRDGSYHFSFALVL